MIQFSMRSMSQDHINFEWAAFFLIDESGITICSVERWAMEKPIIISSHSVTVVVRVIYGHPRCVVALASEH